MPQIFISFTHIYVNSKPYKRFYVKATDVSISGFNVHCGTWVDSIIYEAKVS